MFPQGFTWGAATSAYQIEGAARDDGKGLSIWDQFCSVDGAIHSGHKGDTACDHYGRFEEDIALMSAINLRAYRFSVSWPRVMPTGRAPVNAPGLAFYDRLVDTLLAANIEPWLTLYHWDLPLELHRKGGWLNPEAPRWFEEYTAAVVDALSDRVTHWMTINEPQIFVGLGYGTGVHAPGHKLTFAEQLLIGHRALLAHGRAVQVIRARAKSKPTVGWAPVGRAGIPVSSSRADIEAARRRSVEIDAKGFWNNTWFGDAVCLGKYPEDGLALFGADVPRVESRDMDIISQPIDFYGVNIYSGEPVRAGDRGEPVPVPRGPGYPQTAFGWTIEPESLYWGPRFLFERYGLPIIVTENGLSCFDIVSVDGKVHDPTRIDFLTRYLRCLARAVHDGALITGYFQWSLLDNFEWAEGFRQRFGLIYVDYESGNRILKDSAHWYADVIRSNGSVLAAAETVVRRQGVAPRVTL
ncbi:MAG: GH1 family beta-glucosidase [Planctomycetota bacterium]|nr:GH1 family beta-glucosidase [Planctomycetota bacterium]